MIVTTQTVDVGSMRMLVTAPKTEGRYPGILLYSDIFQLTGPQVRMSARLASYGFLVATPEIWNRLEAPGTALPFDDAGRARGLANQQRTAVADFDADRRAALDWLAPRSTCLGALGFCIGGHLALRAALEPDVRAAVGFYPTGVHDGALGSDPDAGTLARLGGANADLLLVFGTRDPHVPEGGRAAIAAALAAADVRHTIALYDAEHAFLRDEGPRWDPAAGDAAFAQAIAFLRAHTG